MNQTFKNIFIACVVIGYIVGVGWGLSTRENRTEFVDRCIEYDGPARDDPRTGEGPICLRYTTPDEITERPIVSFYTYGLLGAFIGGWLGVLIPVFETPKVIVRLFSSLKYRKPS